MRAAPSPSTEPVLSEGEGLRARGTACPSAAEGWQSHRARATFAAYAIVAAGAASLGGTFESLA